MRVVALNRQRANAVTGCNGSVIRQVTDNTAGSVQCRICTNSDVCGADDIHPGAACLQVETAEREIVGKAQLPRPQLVEATGTRQAICKSNRIGVGVIQRSASGYVDSTRTESTTSGDIQTSAENANSAAMGICPR